MASERQARFTAGKIPPEILLRTVYKNLGRRDKRVLVGPGIGRDSAAVKQNGTVLVFTADPITGTPSHIGQHSVEINANDIATTGARPKWDLCTILLPIGTREKSLKEIAREIHETAKRLGITVGGGHTEATLGIDPPIISGFMIGETRGRGLSAGDEIPVAPATQVIGLTLGLDRLKLMSSGTLLLAVEESKRRTIQKALLKLRGRVAEVGRFTSRDKGRVLVKHGKRQALKAVPQDELYKLT